MKVAFHFNSGHPSVSGWYGPKIEKVVFSRLLSRRTLHLSSKIYIGDLPFHLASTDEERETAVINWFEESQNVWRRFMDRTQVMARCDPFVVCFESMPRGLADYLHGALCQDESYLGAIEVNDSSKFHWNMYSDSLRLEYRIRDDHISVFHDEVTGEEPNDEEKEENSKRLIELGFRGVDYESCAGRHSMFDKYHNYKHARRVAEWKSKYSDMLGLMVDEVVCRLGDAIPKLGDQLWAALNTFENAETDEQYAQVSASCRRVIETVADTLFPPTNETRDNRPLGEPHYRNRLLAWVGDQTKSKTTLETIASSMELFAKHVEALQNLANKGIHSDVQREGARRCLVRTVLLLDDIISLRPESFPIKTELDFSIFDGPREKQED